MDNEFDKQASKILRENVDAISAERWSDEYDIKEVTSTDDLEYADRGDAFSPQINQAIKEFENYLANMEDASVFDLKDIVDEIVAANVLEDDVKVQAIGYLKQRAEAAGLDEDELYGEKGIFSDVPGGIEDQEDDVIKDTPPPPTTNPNDPDYILPIVP